MLFEARIETTNYPNIFTYLMVSVRPAKVVRDYSTIGAMQANTP